jgi:hypothetical protein
MSHIEPTASHIPQALPPPPPLRTLLCMQTPIPDLPVSNLLPISSVIPSLEAPISNLLPSSNPSTSVSTLNSMVNLEDSNLIPGKVSIKTRIPNHHQFYVSTRLANVTVDKPFKTNIDNPISVPTTVVPSVAKKKCDLCYT